MFSSVPIFWDISSCSEWLCIWNGKYPALLVCETEQKEQYLKNLSYFTRDSWFELCCTTEAGVGELETKCRELRQRRTSEGCTQVLFLCLLSTRCLIRALLSKVLKCESFILTKFRHFQQRPLLACVCVLLILLLLH